jgi:hypothetical protein
MSMDEVMGSHVLRSIGLHAAAALMSALVVLCVAAGAAVAALVGGLPGLGLAALAAVATFQALRVPVGRAASWLLERS